MQFYSKREWKGKKALITVEGEMRVVDIEEMTESEFRQFILWRLGLAQEEPIVPNLLVREFVVQSQSQRKTITQAPVRRKVREYDATRVGSNIR